MVNSCVKGKRGERDARDFLRSIGFRDAERTHQHDGTGLSDVVCPQSLPAIHIEVKYGYNRRDFSVGSALWSASVDQAHHDAGSLEWVLLWREKGCVIWKLTFLSEWGLVTVAGQAAAKLCLTRMQEDHDACIDASPSAGR